jgi:hypothetical protein
LTTKQGAGTLEKLARFPFFYSPNRSKNQPMNTRETTEEEKKVIEKTFEECDIRIRKAWNKSEKNANLFNAVAIAINNIRKKEGLKHF